MGPLIIAVFLGLACILIVVQPLLGLEREAASGEAATPTAIATLSAVSGVIGSILEVPRMPSVPKSLRVILLHRPLHRPRARLLWPRSQRERPRRGPPAISFSG